MAIARTAMTDDDGTGTTGTIFNNAWKTELYDQIDAAIGDPYTSYTPTLTNLTLGNGTMIAYYAQIGKTVHFWGRITLGSTSAVGSDPRFTVPVTIDNNLAAVGSNIGIAQMIDTGVTSYVGSIHLISNAAARIFGAQVSGTAIISTTVTATVPFTFGSGDIIFWRGTYAAQ